MGLYKLRNIDQLVITAVAGPRLTAAPPLQYCPFHNTASHESSTRQWRGTSGTTGSADQHLGEERLRVLQQVKTATEQAMRSMHFSMRAQQVELAAEAIQDGPLTYQELLLCLGAAAARSQLQIQIRPGAWV